MVGIVALLRLASSLREGVKFNFGRYFLKVGFSDGGDLFCNGLGAICFVILPLLLLLLFTVGTC